MQYNAEICDTMQDLRTYTSYHTRQTYVGNRWWHPWALSTFFGHNHVHRIQCNEVSGMGPGSTQKRLLMLGFFPGK